RQCRHPHPAGPPFRAAVLPPWGKHPYDAGGPGDSRALPLVSSVSDWADVLRLGALGTLADVEFHTLVVLQRAVAVGRDRRVVNEDVAAAAVLRDEAVALLAV